MRTSIQISVMLRLSLALLLALSSSGLTKKAPEESVYEPDYCEKQLIMWGHRCDPQNCITFCTYARYDTGNCVTNGCLCTNLPCRGKKLND
ncbi:unnamed protein product [Miscanthus lutarioriparius]|uniref:Uncharacterized protein n=1 Tax=Miscanthus lutarioriparius TaxID=422564 RepID=A0A811RLA2_9POAL|nr:unnamed protein product [Miscanthus lutarioriparius]